jgi:hypothetical protein
MNEMRESEHFTHYLHQALHHGSKQNSTPNKVSKEVEYEQLQQGK